MMDKNMMNHCPTRMREVFTFLLLIAASPALAQEDCDNIVTIPELAAQIQELLDAEAAVEVDTIIMVSEGSYEVQLSNGTTYTQVQGCTDPAYLEYDPSANTEDGSCALNACYNPEFDGHTYSVVEIGDQCWFAENLRTTVYGNGDAIPAGLTDDEWTSTNSGATAVYGEGSSACSHYSDFIDACDVAQSLGEFGRLYNWYAVDDARGLCPSGWHVPTDGEWMDLKIYIAGLGYAGSEGNALKSIYGWYEDWSPIVTFGFSALPGGFRFSEDGSFELSGHHGYWWTSSLMDVQDSDAWYRKLEFFDNDIVRAHYDPRFGMSVRCLRDFDLNGCTDPAYVEYDASANIDDGSCATAVVYGCTDPAAVNYNAAANTDDGSCASNSCSSIEFDGYTYSVVEIGDQCWFAENLRTTTYADGSAIPEETDNTAWTGLITGARCDYNNDASNALTYGRLYNWYAVSNGSGLCPSGWHVPTDGEWTALETYLDANGHSGAEGTALKSTSGWAINGNGTDDFGFSALPGGARDNDNGVFYDAGSVGSWWSSSPDGGKAWLRALYHYLPDVYLFDHNPRFGFSVRCLRDAE